MGELDRIKALLVKDPEQLRRMLNVRPEPPQDAPVSENPWVPPPPVFRPSPAVVGQELQGPVKRLLEFAPELRGQVKSFHAGPTRASMDMMGENKLPLSAFAETNLLGVTDLLPGREGEVGISPRVTGRALDRVLGHEASHVVGWPETLAGPIGEAYEREAERTDEQEALQRALAVTGQPRRRTTRLGLPAR